MKREPGSEELWSAIVERLYGESRQAQGKADWRDRETGAAGVLVNAADLELVCRIARHGLKSRPGYRP